MTQYGVGDGAGAAFERTRRWYGGGPGIGLGLRSVARVDARSAVSAIAWIRSRNGEQAGGVRRGKGQIEGPGSQREVARKVAHAAFAEQAGIVEIVDLQRRIAQFEGEGVRCRPGRLRVLLVAQLAVVDVLLREGGADAQVLPCAAVEELQRSVLRAAFPSPRCNWT